jgi:tetrahydromethanopterin S-methyltransferase subunit G
LEGKNRALNFVPLFMKNLPDDFTVTEKTNLTDELIVQSLTKLDASALGIALGIFFGISIFIVTNFLIFKGGDHIGQNLFLLSQYFTGYEITYTGSLIGAFYGLLVGFVLGWLIALLRNTIIRVYLHILKLKSSALAVSDFIDNP